MGEKAYVYQYDGLGSTVAMTDQEGTVVNTYAYDEFGQRAMNAVETVANPFQYVGRWGVMTEAGDLLYMRARHYVPSLGRFLQKDPIGFAGGDLNLYAYVGNNPINLIDPLGLREYLQGEVEEDWGTTLAIGAAAACGIGAGASALAGRAIAGQLGPWAWKIAIHPAHHYFRWFGKLKHIQVIVWRLGARGSGRNFHLPLP